MIKVRLEAHCAEPRSAYGGTSPQLAKGKIERGDSVIDTAWREGEEELGLKKSNMGPRR